VPALSFAKESPANATVDDKSRVALPSNFVRELRRWHDVARLQGAPPDAASTDQLADGEDNKPSDLSVIVTINDDQSLAMYPPSEWDKVVADLDARVAADPNDVALDDFRMAVVGMGSQAWLDAQHRIRLPDSIMKFAGISKKSEVTFWGISNKILVREAREASEFARRAIANYRTTRKPAAK